MNIGSIATRFAGKALGDFLKVGATKVASSAEKAALGYLTSQQGAGGLIGKLASRPETVAKLAGAAAPVAVAGGVAAGASVISNLMQSPSYSYSRSPYTLPVQPSAATSHQASFARQPYLPGTSPMTNVQMGEALLDQQRFQHQLQLIQARQSVSGGAGSLNPSGGISDIMALANRIYG